ncbi:hypothetical protein Pla100_59080 [Neorhodopirellula pilleata]|uniref:Uncharacterized protein n=1 Tax=Neorhodopirellula pilleata TaxID=2714738 RepID=A0A5C5ZMY9_9BACT|nr:hypothetical protein Pla100_59080 [Neorhodopirellula pilleata]
MTLASYHPETTRKRHMHPPTSVFMSPRQESIGGINQTDRAKSLMRNRSSQNLILDTPSNTSGRQGN